MSRAGRVSSLEQNKKQPPLMRRFILFSIILFIVILVSGSIAFIFSMRQIIREGKGVELTQMIEYERLMLESAVNSEISIVLMMAESPLIKQFFSDPGNPELERMAFDELYAYRSAFLADTIFWVNDIDKLFYFNDDEPFFLDAESPDNYWYPMTMNETEVYNFNINYNPDLNVTNLWINAPVFDSDRKPLGIVGTGIELSSFLDMIYEDPTGRLNRIDLYFFNAMGEITGAKEVWLVADKVIIEDELGEVGTGIIERAKSLDHGEIQVTDTTIGRMAIGRLPLLEWYSVAISPDSSADYDNAMTTLFLVMLTVLFSVFVIFNVFIAGLLTPLRRSMKEAENANRAKSQFLSTMSHEMRTPINAVIGMTAIGKSADDIERKDYAFGKIDSASKHLLGVINDVLDMTKIEADKLELSLVEYDFDDMLQKILTVINFRIEEKHQRFSQKIDEKVPRMLIGDDQHLSQVIINLLSNAVKFTPENGEVDLDVNLIDEKDGICELEIIVTDTGIGISPEQQKKLFTMFAQAESGISREYGGTGLGLAISKHIVELMDGQIWVESEVGKGSRFIFTIKVQRGQQEPQGRDTEQGSDMEQSIKDETAAKHNEFAGKRLLVAEDVEINREIILSLLDGTGLIIDVAENGKEAFDMVEAAPDLYDVIFMDMQMPKMDGLEATRRIRELPALEGRKLPIIAMTANVFQSDIDDCFAAGMDHHIGKPLDISEVIKSLRDYI